MGLWPSTDVKLQSGPFMTMAVPRSAKNNLRAPGFSFGMAQSNLVMTLEDDETLLASNIFLLFYMIATE
jgi:hypothetical protein